MEPETFCGYLRKFPEWIRSFEVLQENKTSSPDRLYYLSKYTAGDAKTSIQWFLTLDSVEAYYQAKAALVRRFGDKFKISEAFRSKMEKWPPIKPDDGEGLRRFSDFLHHCMTAMDSISYLLSLNSPEENKKLVRKLPQFIARRWARIVDRWLYGDQSATQAITMDEVYQGTFQPFSEFCKFIDGEAGIACSS